MESSERIRLAILEAARSATPPPDVSITEWAEEHRTLGRSSRLSGLYRTRMTPFWKTPMELLSPRSLTQRVIIRKASQVGCSEMALNVVAFYLAAAPSPVLYAMPTILTAQRFSRQRVSEMLSLSPQLRELMTTPRGGERTNSVLMKACRNGALLLLTGTNAPSMLRSLPIKVLIMDEIDAFPGDTGNEGDPIGLAAERCESYGSSKKILCLSSPTIRFESRIEALYQRSDQRQYHVPCPACGNGIVLQFEQLYLEGTEARYRCQICGGAIGEREKAGMVEAGVWRATATARDPSTAGFAISQLYSTWHSWGDLLARHAAATTPETMQVFVNCSLGETWALPAAIEAPEVAALLARREPFPEGVVPQGGCFLTAGVDVQADRLECEIVAWGRNFESWSVHYFVLYGDITEPTVWDRLDELLSRSWPHASGMPLMVQATAVDAGFSPSEVTQFTRHKHARRVYATKGLSAGWTKPIWPRRASWTKDRHAIYAISSDECKSWVANRMKIESGAGCMHFPISRERGWFEQLTAEKLIIIKGQKRWVNPQKARNEALDARCLAVAALHSRMLAGVDLNAWCGEFERMIAPPPAVVNGSPAPPAAPQVIRSRFVHG